MENTAMQSLLHLSAVIPRWTQLWIQGFFLGVLPYCWMSGCWHFERFWRLIFTEVKQSTLLELLTLEDEGRSRLL